MSACLIRLFALLGRWTVGLGDLLKRVSQRLDKKPFHSTVVKKGVDRTLYRTPMNDLFWLDLEHYVDRCIADSGIYERYSTDIVRKLVKNGDIVLDVGANIGYYSVIMSKIVGSSGKVVAVEPTKYFSKILRENIAANNLSNVDIYEIGLSDKEQDLSITIGESSATLHPSWNPSADSEEKIHLLSLDAFLERYPLERIDFIKIDVDGHEPFFIRGAAGALEKYDPAILLEVSHPHYLEAGFTAWDFYDYLKDNGYNIYDEKNLSEINDKSEFLKECGNFDRSANILIRKRKLSLS